MSLLHWITESDGWRKNHLQHQKQTTICGRIIKYIFLCIIFSMIYDNIFTISSCFISHPGSSGVLCLTFSFLLQGHLSDLFLLLQKIFNNFTTILQFSPSTSLFLPSSSPWLSPTTALYLQKLLPLLSASQELVCWQQPSVQSIITLTILILEL